VIDAFATIVIFRTKVVGPELPQIVTQAMDEAIEAYVENLCFYRPVGKPIILQGTHNSSKLFDRTILNMMVEDKTELGGTYEEFTQTLASLI